MGNSIFGRLEEVKASMSKRNKKFWKIKISGVPDMLFVWDWDVIANAKIGQEVEVITEKSDDGKFVHVTECLPVLNVDGEPSELPTPIHEYTAPDSDKETEMARMSALKTAAAFLNGKPDTTQEEIIAAALRFLEFIKTGD